MTIRRAVTSRVFVSYTSKVENAKQVYTVYSAEIDRERTFFMQSFPTTFPAGLEVIKLSGQREALGIT